MKSDNINTSNRVRVNQKERKFLLENEECRIATSHDDVPHVVPVAYIYEKEYIIFVTDYGTRKYRNLQVNRNVSIVVDVYDPSGKNKAIIIQGKAVIIERGKEFIRLYKIFDKKFEWVRKNPWKEGEAPFVRVVAFKKVSWGL